MVALYSYSLIVYLRDQFIFEKQVSSLNKISFNCQFQLVHGANQYTMLTDYTNGHTSRDCFNDSHTKLQSSAVITRSDTTWYCIQYSNYWGRIYIRICVHNKHPTSRTYRRAMGVPILTNWENIDRVMTAPRCSYLDMFIRKAQLYSHKPTNIGEFKFIEHYLALACPH